MLLVKKEKKKKEISHTHSMAQSEYRAHGIKRVNFIESITQIMLMFTYKHDNISIILNQREIL